MWGGAARVYIDLTVMTQEYASGSTLSSGEWAGLWFDGGGTEMVPYAHILALRCKEPESSPGAEETTRVV